MRYYVYNLDLEFDQFFFAPSRLVEGSFVQKLVSSSRHGS